MGRPKENRRVNSIPQPNAASRRASVEGARKDPGRAPAAKRQSIELDRAVRSARISVAEYARALGVRDPEEIVKFSRYCVRRALGRSPSRGMAAGLVKRALDVAASTVGIDERRLNTAAQGSGSAESESAGGTLVGPVDFVPRAKRRAMPRQPLGEMPDAGDLGETTVRWVRKSVQALVGSAPAGGGAGN